MAAYNSIDNENADFVCDGENDQVEINAAIDNLPTIGGSIYLREGTYIISDNIIISKSNVTLVGAGASTVIKIRDSHNADIRVIHASGKSKLLILDLRIDGNKANNGIGIMHGIHFENVVHSKIIDCWIENLRDKCGIWLQYSNNCTVSNNIVQEIDSPGIHLENSDNNNVTGNIFTGNGQHGIFVERSSNNTIGNNTCQGNSSRGIYLDNSDSNTVTGNTCQGNGYEGIRLSYSTNNTVTGNTCEGNGWDGIRLSYSANNTVTGNTYEGNDLTGIYLRYSNNNTVTGNTCQGNTLVGIFVYDSSYITVTGNTCISNDEYGILLNSSNSNTVSSNTVVNNSQSAHDTYDGIRICVDSDYNNIQGNTVRRGTGANQQRYGLRIHTADCDNNLVANNDLYQAGVTANFSDAGTGTISDYSQSGTAADLVQIDSTGLKENTITFPVKFHTAPYVTANLTNFDNDEAIAYVVQIKSVTTDNFTIICYVVTDSATAGHNADLYWHATVASQSGNRE